MFVLSLLFIVSLCFVPQSNDWLVNFFSKGKIFFSPSSCSGIQITPFSANKITLQ